MHTQTLSAAVIHIPDAELGIAWWNSLHERVRATWCQYADTATPATAWAFFKREMPHAYQLLLSPVTKTAPVCLAAMAAVTGESVRSKTAS